MTILVHLENPVNVFAPNQRQMEWFRAQLPQHEVLHALTEHEFLEALPHAETVLVWQFLAEWYALAPRLQRVLTPAAGRESVARDPSGRVAAHFGSFHGAIMAESLLGMMLFLKRRFAVALSAQQRRVWDRRPYASSSGLAGETALLIGFGAIGQECARVLRAVGMQVHGLRRSVTPTEQADRMFGADQLLEAVALADHVVCILPGDTATDALLAAPAFENMKPSVFVYNLGRGNAIDTAALCEALALGRVQGAFLDVLPEEPLSESSPLWSTPQLFLTPHASAIRRDYLDLFFAEAVRRI